MKTIMCYGDSNTHGAIPADTQHRFPRHLRWTGRLQEILGSDYYIIEEGLNGRTTVNDDPIELGRCGREYLMPCLISHKPLDAVILMLGTNDLKPRFSFSAHDIGRGAALLVEIIQKSECGPNNQAPQVLLMAPAPLTRLSEYGDEFTGGEAKSRDLARYYQMHARELGCEFLDAGKVITCSDLDGVHFDASQHDQLARALADFILNWKGL